MLAGTAVMYKISSLRYPALRFGFPVSNLRVWQCRLLVAGIYIRHLF